MTHKAWLRFIGVPVNLKIKLFLKEEFRASLEVFKAFWASF